MTKTLASIQRVNRDEWGYAHGFGWSLALKVDLRDVWVGVYWNPHPGGGMLDVYVCLLPCLPIHLCLWGLR